jgi:hypothetical protein
VRFLGDALTRDQADRDVIAAQLLRYRDEPGDGWADMIDMLTMHPGGAARDRALESQASVLGRRSDAPTPLYVLPCTAAGWSSGPDRGSQWLALRFNPGPRH